MRVIGILAILCVSMVGFSFGQNHSQAIASISTVEAARNYAHKYREVSVSLINAESDRLVFDEIDTVNIESNNGKSFSFFGRNIKLLKDTALMMADIQVISFDLTSTSRETSELLRSQMIKRLENGETYWDLSKKYAHTSAQFRSGPRYMSEIMRDFSLRMDDAIAGDQFLYDNSKSEMGILIVNKTPFSVLAFYTIGYNSTN